MREHGFDASRNPILKPLDTIECRDALLNPDGTETEWPAADVIVGNPPFLGSKFMRKGRPANKKKPAILGLGDEYVDRLFATYIGAPPASANFVSYWFQKSLRQLEGGATGESAWSQLNRFVSGPATNPLLTLCARATPKYTSLSRMTSGQSMVQKCGSQSFASDSRPLQKAVTFSMVQRSITFILT